MPILNASVSAFRGPICSFANSVIMEAISSDEYGAVWKRLGSERASLINPKSKCIKVLQPRESEPLIETARNEATKTAFVLNYFRERDPIALSFAFHLTKQKRTRLSGLLDLSFVGDTYVQNRTRFQLASDATRDKIREFYQVLTCAQQKSQGLILTLGRFNSALVRQDGHDKIVDISISLESLIEGTAEQLSHKFATYNAWAAEPDSSKRRQVFDTLRTLYSARSAIVHGDVSRAKKIAAVIDKWGDVSQIAARALAYHILFLYEHSPSEWYRHQQDLVLGLDARIV